MLQENTIIIGGGPCGIACAIELKKHGINPLIIEKGNIVNTIYRFPTHQVFFSTSDKLELADMLFTTERSKPIRNEALSYYRQVVKRNKLRINAYEAVIDLNKTEKGFKLTTNKSSNNLYEAKHVIVATGYYDQPNLINVPGESLKKVTHYFKEAHPYFQKNVVVIGGRNSAVDAALELHKAGAKVTVLYRGSKYSDHIKPWILPEFISLVQNESINLEFNAVVNKITEKHVYYSSKGIDKRIINDFVFAMTGYRPDLDFLRKIGIIIHDQTGKPQFHNETLETNIPHLFVAGVVIAGYNNNDIFIENGRFHGQKIAKRIIGKI